MKTTASTVRLYCNRIGISIIILLDKVLRTTTFGAFGADTVPTFNYCTKCVGSPRIIHDRTSDWHQFLGMDAWATLQLEVAFDSQATWVSDVLGLLFDMLSMGVCTARNRQTSG